MADHQETLEIEVKALDGLEIKDDERGEIEAVIATLDVVDRDRDIIRPMAIKDGARVKLSDYGHSAAFGAAPVGKGTLRIEGNKVLFRGKYFMSTSRGSEAFKMMKEIGPDESEWSFGFHVEGDEPPGEADRKKGAFRILTKLDSFEVSPVMRGAGIGTRTVSVKAAGVSAPPEPPAVIVVESEADLPPTAPEGTIAVEVADAEVQRIAAEFEAKQLEQRRADEVAYSSEAQRMAEVDAQLEAQDAERKRLADEVEIKRLRDAAADEFERFQRTRRYLAT